MTALTDCPPKRRGPSIHSLIARYGLEAKLALIPWDQLPVQLQEFCNEFLHAWWESLDPDEPIEPSGLLGMTVAQLLIRLELAARGNPTARLVLGPTTPPIPACLLSPSRARGISTRQPN